MIFPPRTARQEPRPPFFNGLLRGVPIDGRWLALANEVAGRLEIVDTQTGKLTRQFDSRSCRHALFSASGDVLAFDGVVDPPGIGRELRLLDWPSGERRAIVPRRSVYTSRGSL